MPEADAILDANSDCCSSSFRRASPAAVEDDAKEDDGLPLSELLCEGGTCFLPCMVHVEGKIHHLASVCEPAWECSAVTPWVAYCETKPTKEQ